MVVRYVGSVSMKFDPIAITKNKKRFENCDLLFDLERLRRNIVLNILFS